MNIWNSGKKKTKKNSIFQPCTFPMTTTQQASLIYIKHNVIRVILKGHLFLWIKKKKIKTWRTFFFSWKIYVFLNNLLFYKHTHTHTHTHTHGLHLHHHCHHLEQPPHTHTFMQIQINLNTFSNRGPVTHT